jgi:cobyrinic acid a,c-diamide synthase
MKIPRVVIAGTQSGAGKTSLTLALAALLRRRGLKVQTFKVGPDYLDPGYLALASGRPCYNLDGWMMGRDYVENLFCRAAADCDIAIIEGVMGLFDGADAVSGDGSTAQIAEWLRAPVLLVIPAHGMARSLAATALGYARFDPGVNVAGILANQCGSDSHIGILREALRAGCGQPLPPLLGWARRGGIPALAGRHLGLISASPRTVPDELINQLADALVPFLDIDEILRIAREAQPFAAGGTKTSLSPSSALKWRLGVARDEAFHFYYPDNLDALHDAGCELVFFSPLTDANLPENLDGLYFGGGYPEEYAAELSGNKSMLEQIARFQKLIYAECGGLMYLSEGIEIKDGSRYPQVGRLPAWVRMSSGRKALGYVEVTLTRRSLWGEPGDTLRGHEYHYSELTRQPEWETVYSLTRRRDGVTFNEGFQFENVLASYVHLHFASRPLAMENFIRYLEEQ